VKIGNYPGLFCENSGHIHNYVYELEDICAKAAEWTRSRVSNRYRGFSARFARHRSDLKDSGELKGVMCKVATSSSSFDSEQKTGGAPAGGFGQRRHQRLGRRGPQLGGGKGKGARGGLKGGLTCGGA
jgi:hypothetical protein